MKCVTEIFLRRLFLAHLRGFHESNRNAESVVELLHLINKIHYAVWTVLDILIYQPIQYLEEQPLL